MAFIPALRKSASQSARVCWRSFASTSRVTQEHLPTSSSEVLETEPGVTKPAANSKRSYVGRYQNLLSFDPLLDVDLLNSVVSPDALKARGIHGRDPLAVIHRNRQTIFRPSTPPASAFHGKQDTDPLEPIRHVFPDMKLDAFESMHRYALNTRRFQIYRRHLGKVPVIETMACVGNGQGMLGLGVGYAADAIKARDEAYMRAIKNMTPVNLCEGRTIWNRRESKLSATVIKMWPRPPGFGISTRSAVMSRMCKAAGIKDITVRIRRSRNRYFVAQLLWRMLKAEGMPIGYGNGVGRAGDRLEKGIGMMSHDQTARALGRRSHWHV